MRIKPIANSGPWAVWDVYPAICGAGPPLSTGRFLTASCTGCVTPLNAIDSDWLGFGNSLNVNGEWIGDFGQPVALHSVLVVLYGLNPAA